VTQASRNPHGDQDPSEHGALKQAFAFLRHAPARIPGRAFSQTQSCSLCASKGLRHAERPARALNRARNLKRIDWGEILIANRGREHRIPSSIRETVALKRSSESNAVPFREGTTRRGTVEFGERRRSAAREAAS